MEEYPRAFINALALDSFIPDCISCAPFWIHILYFLCIICITPTLTCSIFIMCYYTAKSPNPLFSRGI
ncbi:hypothetical protein XELAEV_18042895mg [Xenopus laevis]|uniref:Uncharacterized protein n=1 Tax=Xenopus laevis TaxID=8355 RepID=A0A974C527_XENLA|nr:hypothetical protein XELAEV_18042895mg [Xenopus laevis]